jgi:hypothetical protein
MTILQTLTPELSTTSSLARARRSAPALALCVLGLFATTACGSIENSEDVADLGPGPTTTNDDGARGATSPAQRTPTATANADDDSETNDVSSRERDDDDLARSGSSSRTRGGGSVRTRVSDLQSDAGDVDAGDVDAGDVDAGEIEIEVDAGDAGVAL